MFGEELRVSVTQRRSLWGLGKALFFGGGSHRLSEVLISLWRVGGISEEVLEGSLLCASESLCRVLEVVPGLGMSLWRLSGAG